MFECGVSLLVGNTQYICGGKLERRGTGGAVSAVKAVGKGYVMAVVAG